MSEPQDQLAEMLSERGVTGVHGLIEGLDEAELEGAVRAVIHWDSISQAKTPGLLVHFLREREFPRAPTPAKAVHTAPSEKLLASMRGRLRTPNGISREEARWTYEPVAKRFGMAADALINAAMGAAWQETKPHPAFDPENPNVARDYERLLSNRPEGKKAA